ncbi:MAG: hypothetical protein U0575_04580 [Phycisphaerales bacterium]
MPSIDEGPTPDDLRRFNRETGYCPDCGAEVFDQADVCPKCFAYLGGDVLSKHPIQRWWNRKWIGLVIAAVLVAMLLMTFGWRVKTGGW